MPYYLAADKAKDAEFQKRGWTEIVQHIHATDPFKHPVSLHPTDLSRTQVTDASVLDFEMLQTGHGDRASILPTIDLVRRSRQAKPTMPTINSEVCYEGILGKCHDDVVRMVTWPSLLGGTAGHTYGANGIWQLNRKEQEYGKSPHGGNWGTTPWDEAMKLPGSRQVGEAKKLLERFEWWKFEPHPEWVGIDGDVPATGRSGPNDGAIPPSAAGIPDRVRVIYVPGATRIRVTQLKPVGGWKAEYFNPATGGTTSAGPNFTIDVDGTARISPPADARDWVLILRRI